MNHKHVEIHDERSSENSKSMLFIDGPRQDAIVFTNNGSAFKDSQMLATDDLPFKNHKSSNKIFSSTNKKQSHSLMKHKSTQDHRASLVYKAK